MPRELICRVSRHGVEDSEFYSGECSDGRLFIEKRLIPGRHPLAGLLPRLEKTMLAHLATLGLPIARTVNPGYADMNSVMCEFTGPNLRHLTLEAGASEQDVAALWATAIDATAAFAEAGVLVTDWAARNVTFKLESGLSGKIDLRQAWLLDHALTVSAATGAPVQRYPLWASARQLSFAPEVRAALEREQVEAIEQLQRAGYKQFKKLGDLAESRQAESLLREIDLSGTSIQHRLKFGEIDAGRAMQYAIGQQALEMLALLEHRADKTGAQPFLEKHSHLWQHMCATQPSDHVPPLREVAATIRGGSAPRVYSSVALQPLVLRDLIVRPEHPGTASGPEATLPTQDEAINGSESKVGARSWTDTIASSRAACTARPPASAVGSDGWSLLRVASAALVLTLAVLLAGQAMRPLPGPNELGREAGLTEVHVARACLASWVPEEAARCARQLVALAGTSDAVVKGMSNAALYQAWNRALAIASNQRFDVRRRSASVSLAIAIQSAGYPPAALYLDKLARLTENEKTLAEGNERVP